MKKTNDQAKDYLREQLEDYLRGKGIDTRKPFSCLDKPRHEDKHPSMSFNGKINKVKCFSCGISWDIFDLIGHDYNLSNFNDQMKKACEIYGIELEKDFKDKPLNWDSTISDTNPQNTIQTVKTTNYTSTRKEPEIRANTSDTEPKQEKDYTELYRKWNNNLKQTGYLRERGISDELANKFLIGYDPKSRNLIIPNSKHSYLQRRIDVKTDSKGKAFKKGEQRIFNIKELEKDSTKPIIICEGEIDALSIMQVGGRAIGLGGTGNTNKLIDYLKNTYESQGKELKAPLILALDNDPRGEEATEKLEKELETFKNIKYETFIFYGDYKDANEFLMEDRQGLTTIVKNVVAAKYISEKSNQKYAEEFLQTIGKDLNTPAISTGFDILDNKLDGGLYEGLYTIGAISSLGKTTFVLQIADQIAKDGKDVLIFSLEMSRNELIAKSISRETRIIAEEENKNIETKPSTVREITNSSKFNNLSKEKQELIKKSIRRYSTYANHIFIKEGIGSIGAKEIKEKVKKHIEKTGRTPVVIVDYLQILKPEKDTLTDKQATDRAVLALKILSRDYHLPVIAISSFNRENYNAAVSLKAFKESGAIEYSSDVVIGLQLGISYTKQNKEKSTDSGTSDFSKDYSAKIDDQKKKVAREIQLKILKQRNGEVGATIDYQYYTKFNHFYEYFGSDNKIQYHIDEER